MLKINIVNTKTKTTFEDSTNALNSPFLLQQGNLNCSFKMLFFIIFLNENVFLKNKFLSKNVLENVSHDFNF